MGEVRMAVTLTDAHPARIIPARAKREKRRVVIREVRKKGVGEAVKKPVP
jgi:hypothetical protein